MLKRIEDNPFRDDINTYKGFEMLYTILNAEKMFKRVRNVSMLGISLEKFAPNTEIKKKYQDMLKIGSEKYDLVNF